MPHVISLLNEGSAMRTAVDSTSQGSMPIFQPFLRVVRQLFFFGFLLRLSAPEVGVGISLEAIGLKSDGTGLIVFIIVFSVDFLIVDPPGTMATVVKLRRLVISHVVFA